MNPFGRSKHTSHQEEQISCMAYCNPVNDDMNMIPKSSNLLDIKKFFPSIILCIWMKAKEMCLQLQENRFMNWDGRFLWLTQYLVRGLLENLRITTQSIRVWFLLQIISTMWFLDIVLFLHRNMQDLWGLEDFWRVQG